MIYPSLSKLMEKVDSRYSLVVATAKRARELVEGAEPLVKCNNDKPVTIAINEIYNSSITFDEASDKQVKVFYGREAKDIKDAKDARDARNA